VRALVTGATGFVGRHLVAHLAAAGDDVAISEAEITEPDALEADFEGSRPDAVYHLAAQAGFYCTLALAILFFSLWFRLLNMADGESFSEADNVAWYLVAVLNPLVLGTVGAGLWKSAGKG